MTPQQVKQLHGRLQGQERALLLQYSLTDQSLRFPFISKAEDLRTLTRKIRGVRRSLRNLEANARRNGLLAGEIEPAFTVETVHESVDF